MKIHEFIWPEDRVEHIARHGIHPEEVEEVCFSRALVQRTRSAGANPAYYVLGQTAAGRYLFSVVIQFPDGNGFPDGVDQQVRDIEIGKAHVGIGMVHRGKLDGPSKDSVAEHDQVSEVYHIIEGTATLVLGPDITNRQRRPNTLRTVIEFNGPGNNGSEIRNGKAYDLKPGDVVVIPAGTGHLFTKIDDHIDYLMVRIDPDKVTPVRSEVQSKDYLSKPAPRGQ